MISGSGAQMQMQSTSYIPAYYHIIDQNVGGGGGSLWQVLGSSSSSTCKIGMVYNVLPESSNSDPYLAYSKGILRQTMLKHEAVFRNQVHELHRLYGRQKELMDEISRNRWRMQSSQSNLISSQIQYHNFQKAYSATSVSPGDEDKQPENFQMPSSTDVVSEKSIRAHCTINIKENSLEEQRTSMSKSCYSGKRMLDLELPAEEYIDSEDEQEVLKKRNPVQIMPQIQYEHSKNSLKLNETSSNGSSNCSKTTFLFDLNEPIQLDESEMPNSTDFIDSATDNIMSRDQDSFGKSKLGSHVQNEESTYNVQEGKGDEGNGLTSGRQDSSTGGSILGSKVVKKESEAFDENNQSVLCSCITNSCPPVLISNEAKTEASTSVSSQQTLVCKSREVVPFAIQALPCFNNPELLSKKSSSNSGIKRKYCNSKGNPASTPPSLESVSYDNEHAAEQSSPVERIKKAHHANSSEHIVVVDVMPKTDVSQEKHSRTDEASSSENSKRQFIRPRMKPDFDGTNLKAPLTPDKNEHPPPSEDLDRIAAEAIVSISSSDTQQRLKIEKIALLPEVSAGSDCLSWFASIASCVTSEQEIDEFEFESLSFKLNGMNLEDCCCPQIQSHEEEEKGRGKKKNKMSRQKKGSLSCITSLHSSNVIKNLEPAGTMIKAVRCFGGCRRRTGGRRSKKLKTVTTNEIEIETETEKKVCSILKQHTATASHEELSFTLKSLLGWGSKNRRQKSRHAPANCLLDF